MIEQPGLPTNDSRVCARCGKWIYWDNGDVTYNCLCNAGWTWASKYDASQKWARMNPPKVIPPFHVSDEEPIPPSEQLCEDEGCPHHGTLHVCIDKPVPPVEQIFCVDLFEDGTGQWWPESRYKYKSTDKAHAPIVHHFHIPFSTPSTDVQCLMCGSPAGDNATVLCSGCNTERFAIWEKNRMSLTAEVTRLKQLNDEGNGTFLAIYDRAICAERQVALDATEIEDMRRFIQVQQEKVRYAQDEHTKELIRANDLAAVNASQLAMAVDLFEQLMNEAGDDWGGNEVLTVRHLRQRVADLTTERDQMKSILVEATNAIPGCGASQEVSVDFLAQVPGEIALHAKSWEEMKAKFETTSKLMELYRLRFSADGHIGVHWDGFILLDTERKITELEK